MIGLTWFCEKFNTKLVQRQTQFFESVQSVLEIQITVEKNIKITSLFQ
jgi:hypothetical protein